MVVINELQALQLAAQQTLILENHESVRRMADLFLRLNFTFLKRCVDHPTW